MSLPTQNERHDLDSNGFDAVFSECCHTLESYMRGEIDAKPVHESVALMATAARHEHIDPERMLILLKEHCLHLTSRYATSGPDRLAPVISHAIAAYFGDETISPRGDRA